MSQVPGHNNQNQLTAAVFCFDSAPRRRIEFGQLLSRFFSHVWLISSPSEWRQFDRIHQRESRIPPNERYNIHNISALFIHTGNIELLPNDLGALNASYKFYFNAPGTPQVLPPDLPIYRSTDPFDLNATDAQEIAEYVAGRRGDVPRCCRPKDIPDLLLSLAILCQGYLAVHAEYENGAWGPHEITEALNQMGWSSFANHPGNALYLGRLPDKRSAVSSPDWWSAAIGTRNVIEKISNEWGVARIEDCPLKSLVEAIYETGDLRPSVVVSAYSALVTKLQGKT